MIIKLRRKSSRYGDLTLGQPYVVIGIEADELRILNDAGRPYLYPAKLFQVLDDHEPSEWLSEFGEDDERYAYPLAFNNPGFFEDFFDDKPKAVKTFWRVLNQWLATVTEAA